MTEFYKSDTYLIVRAMKATGNQPGVVAQWKDMVALWARAPQHAGPAAEAVNAWLPHWQVRPCYTAAELSPLMPALSVMMGFTDRLGFQKSPNRLANELKFAGLPIIRAINPAGFGFYEEFFIVERLHHWPKVFAEAKEVSDTEFLKCFKEAYHALG